MKDTSKIKRTFVNNFKHEINFAVEIFWKKYYM